MTHNASRSSGTLDGVSAAFAQQRAVRSTHQQKDTDMNINDIINELEADVDTLVDADDLITHFEVFHINRQTGWAYAAFACHIQVNDADYCYRKADAIKYAKEDAAKHGVPVKVFSMSGKLMK